MSDMTGPRHTSVVVSIAEKALLDAARAFCAGLGGDWKVTDAAALVDAYRGVDGPTAAEYVTITRVEYDRLKATSTTTTGDPA